MDEPDRSEMFEELALQALASAVADLHGLGYTPMRIMEKVLDTLDRRYMAGATAAPVLGDPPF